MALIIIPLQTKYLEWSFLHGGAFLEGTSPNFALKPPTVHHLFPPKVFRFIFSIFSLVEVYSFWIEFGQGFVWVWQVLYVIVWFGLVDTIPASVSHFGPTNGHFGFCRRCGVADGERVAPAPLRW